MSTAPPPPPAYNEKDSNNYHRTAPGPIMQQPIYIGSPIFIPSEYPLQCVCPNCKQPIVTRIEKQNGLLTWLLVGGLVFFGCWFGCCLIPLCVDACKDTAHYCPNCSHFFGVKKQMS